MTGETDLGWSLKRSPASWEASSITHMPCAGEACRPRESRTVWCESSGMLLSCSAGAPFRRGRSAPRPRGSGERQREDPAEPGEGDGEPGDVVADVAAVQVAQGGERAAGAGQRQPLHE